MERFFSHSSVEGLAQLHVEKVENLEEKEMKRILLAYRRVRQDLRDRLDTIPRGTFTAQKMSGTLVQVEAAISAMSKILRDEMADSSEILAETGVTQLIEELNKWNKQFTGAVIPINIDAALIASDTSELLFNKHEASLAAYSESLRSIFAQRLTDAVIAQTPTYEVVQGMGQVFLGEEWRMQRLVRTELHNAFNIGKLSGMVETRDNVLPDLTKTLWHTLDERTGDDTRRLNRNNPIVPVDKEFVEDSTGKTVRYMAPPNRPNDRAILIPYRAAWTK